MDIDGILPFSKVSPRFVVNLGIMDFSCRATSLEAGAGPDALLANAANAVKSGLAATRW